MLQFLCTWMLAFLGAALLPMKPVRLRLGELLAADATTLAPALAANKIALVKAPFNVNEDLVLGTLTLADFTGSTPIAGATGTQQAGVDPVTGQQKVTVLTPVGGWRWETADLVHLPQTIYGFVLLNDAGDTLLGAELLPAGTLLQTAGQFIDLGAVELSFVLRPLS